MRKLALILFLSGSITVAANDPSPVIKITKIETIELASPLYQNDDGDDSIQVDGTSIDDSTRTQWLRISARYETRPEWLDRLTLEFYVLMPDSETSGMLFKGAVHYVDIPRGRNHLAEMYIHFNSYNRYKKRRGKIKTAVVAKIDGARVSMDNQNIAEELWWENKPTHPAGLLNRLNTPFGVVNPANYAAQILRGNE